MCRLGLFLIVKETIMMFGPSRVSLNVRQSGQSYHQIQQNLPLFPKMPKSGLPKMGRLGFSSQ